jgi:hypothetical protein
VIMLSRHSRQCLLGLQPNEDREGEAEGNNGDHEADDFNLTSLILRMPVTGATYSLRLVIRGLEAMGTTYTKHSTGGPSFSLHHTGCRVPLGDGWISIQTHPLIAGEAFAETLIHGCPAFQLEDHRALGYCYENDVHRFDIPEELFAHVRQVLQLYAAKAGQGLVNEGGHDASSDAEDEEGPPSTGEAS